ncbi:hypothetical protein NN561_004146 [Cricetulus griseus]
MLCWGRVVNSNLGGPGQGEGRSAGAPAARGWVPAGTKAELCPLDRAFLRGVGPGRAARGERARGGSFGCSHHPCRVRARCLPRFPAPLVPAFPAPSAPRMNGRRVRPPRQDGDARLCQLGPRRPPPGLKTKAGPGGRRRGRRGKAPGS